FQMESADLIFSNMALQWSIDLRKVFLNIYAALKKKSFFAFSMPISGTFSEFTKTLQDIDVQFVPNSFVELRELSQWMLESGFLVRSFKINSFIFYYSSVLYLLRSIKNTGSNFLWVSPQSNQIKIKALENSFRKNPFPLTYRIAIVIAEKI